MGKSSSPLKGLFLTLFLPALILSSCTPEREEHFSDRLVVKEEYGLPLEVLKAQLKFLKRGGERIELLLKNGSKKKLLLECDVYFLTEDGLKVSVPGFEQFLCKVPPKGTKRVKIELPLVGVRWETAVVRIRAIENSEGNR